jgi:hypothetical protein
MLNKGNEKANTNMYQESSAHLLLFLSTLLQSENKTKSITPASCCTGSIGTSATHEKESILR